MKNEQKRTSGARRLGRAGIATAVIAATVVGGLGLATSASATNSSAREKVVEAWSSPIPALSTILIPRLACPSDAPYLVDFDFSPGRIVPRGVEVIEQGGGVGVTSLKTYVAGTGDYARGMGLPASATNWWVQSNNITILLHCTGAVRGSYFVPPDSRDWGY